MNRKEGQNVDDPYQLIRRLRNIIQTQKQSLEQYKMICDSLVHEKEVALNQIAQLKKQIQYLSKKIQQQKLLKTTTIQSCQDLFMVRQVPKESRLSPNIIGSPIRKNDVANSRFTLLGSPSESTLKKEFKNSEFIPGLVSFHKKRQSIFGTNGQSIDSVSEMGQNQMGEYLIEDFMIIGPDIIELKRLRQEHRQQKELKIQKYTYFNLNKVYQYQKAEYLDDVAKRSFPMGALARRKAVQNIEQFKLQMEFITEGKMGQDFFIINLKGDFDRDQKIFLGNCNPFKALYAVCLRVPDFIPIKDEKYYQRREQQVWMVEKVYAILTYFPFLPIHLALLAKIHKILQPKWHSLHRQEIFTRNLSRNLAEAQKNQEVRRMVSQLMATIPDFNQVCQIQKNYFGTVPNFGSPAEYTVSKFACPIFFSIFAYEQMLLLLSALFLQKNIIFASKSESAGTLCALFLVSIIAPFVYNCHLILNCTNQILENIVFGFPLPLVASFKKPTNFTKILSSFIDNNKDHFKGYEGKKQTAPLILVDIDSNSIFYDPQLNPVFQQIISEPSKELRDAYQEVNPTHSKSFSFPKKMPVQFSGRFRSETEKNAEQKKKLLKQYQQKIDNNTSKWPTFTANNTSLKLHDLLTDYIRTFSIDRDCHYEVGKLRGQERKKYSRDHLMKKHGERGKFVDVVVNSQLFADYLDQIAKMQGQTYNP